MTELSKVMYAPDIKMTKSLLTSFLNKWAKKEISQSFIEYFRAEWEGKVEHWSISSRGVVGQIIVTTTSAIEAYHGILKENYLRSSD